MKFSWRILIEFLLMAIWLGVLVTSGYIAAPILFQHLPAMIAGDIAGELFHITSMTGIIAALALYISGFSAEGRHFWRSGRGLALSFTLLWVLINEFILTPVIVALKTGQSHPLVARFGNSFGAWHGISQVIYLITAISLLGLIYLWLTNWRVITKNQ